MSVKILGVRRYQREDAIFLCVHGFADDQPTSIEGMLCRVSELPSLPPEAEDEKIEELSRRLAKRPWWRSFLATLKNTFKPKQKIHL